MVQSVIEENIVAPSVSEVVGKDVPKGTEEVASKEATTSASAGPCKEIVESEVSKEPVSEDNVTTATVSADAEVETETKDAKVEDSETKVEPEAKGTEGEVVATNEIASGDHQEPQGVPEDMIAKEESKRPLEDDETSESSKKSKSEM